MCLVAHSSLNFIMESVSAPCQCSSWVFLPRGSSGAQLISSRSVSSWGEFKFLCGLKLQLAQCFIFLEFHSGEDVDAHGSSWAFLSRYFPHLVVLTGDYSNNLLCFSSCKNKSDHHCHLSAQVLPQPYLTNYIDTTHTEIAYLHSYIAKRATCKPN